MSRAIGSAVSHGPITPTRNSVATAAAPSASWPGKRREDRPEEERGKRSGVRPVDRAEDRSGDRSGNRPTDGPETRPRLTRRAYRGGACDTRARPVSSHACAHAQEVSAIFGWDGNPASIWGTGVRLATAHPPGITIVSGSIHAGG